MAITTRPAIVLERARRGGGGSALLRMLDAAVRPIRSAERGIRRLHAVEHEGEAWETPFIAITGLFFFFLSIYLVMVGLAFAAYYLA